MPTYDYKCEKCGHTFEEDLKIADRKIPTEEQCRFPTCNGEVTQIITVPGFAYDNIKTRHSVKPAAVGQLDDRLKDIKSRMPGNTL